MLQSVGIRVPAPDSEFAEGAAFAPEQAVLPEPTPCRRKSPLTYAVVRRDRRQGPHRPKTTKKAPLVAQEAAVEEPANPLE